MPDAELAKVWVERADVHRRPEPYRVAYRARELRAKSLSISGQVECVYNTQGGSPHCYLLVCGSLTLDKEDGQQITIETADGPDSKAQ
jgi:hypothetical protein